MTENKRNLEQLKSLAELSSSKRFNIALQLINLLDERNMLERVLVNIKHVHERNGIKIRLQKINKLIEVMDEIMHGKDQ